jgi:F-type H+-transporting ATPase subunit delta
MQNPKLASRYAKSLMDIATEQNALDAVFEDMSGINAMIKSSSELDVLLKSPIINSEKKNSILSALLGDKVNKVSLSFTQLLTNKKRESFLQEIAAEYISQYKSLKNIASVSLTTAEPLTDELKESILTKIKQQLKTDKVDLVTKVDPKLIGGFILESNNNLFDASMARDLKDIQSQFLKNIYVPNININ